jgi:glycosyltransferase involved in cell wall biosynthesis
MDRGMPPRVTYWTGTWDPAKEAISKEVDALRIASRARAPVVSFSLAQSTRILPRDRVIMLSGRAWLALRGVAAMLEPRGDVTHVFGGRSSWHLLRALGRRPILLTAAVLSKGVGGLPHTNIARVVIESETALGEWTEAGIPRGRIELIRPGIDLEWYRPAPARSQNRFTLLFASTPSDATEMAPRGIPLLVELARLRPLIDIVVPWREWGDIGAARQALEALRPPSNFIVKFGDVADMRSQYADAHATVVCFDRIGKTCPSFVIEGLAAGRPCISTEGIGLAGDLSRSGAGIVVPRDVAALAVAVDQLRMGWAGFSARARQLAEELFDLRTFLTRYDQLYREIISDSGSKRR